MRAFGQLILVLVVLAAIFAIVILHDGISARSEPTVIERTIARTMRHFAIPRALRNARNPVPLTPATLAEGRAHWADHCAACHANDGSGNTEMGRGLYPKPPDMRRARTQQLSDGELFAIIKNGVRLTGMPAWGDAKGHDDAATWKLVHFIRHLPHATPAELAAMEKLNPKSPDEWREMQAEQDFLNGGAAPPAAHDEH
jgi:mono/diheme cytochrome c family protein